MHACCNVLDSEDVIRKYVETENDGWHTPRHRQRPPNMRNFFRAAVGNAVLLSRVCENSHSRRFSFRGLGQDQVPSRLCERGTRFSSEARQQEDAKRETLRS
jgi:hypothetical protein